MTTYPNAPKVVRSGLVLTDPASGRVQRIVTLQYNPDALARSFQVQGVDGDGAGRSGALRLKGPAIETYKLDAEIDAADQLQFPERHRATVEHGIGPQLAALELLLYPGSGQLDANHALAGAGTLEILPMEAPLVLFVWGRNRIVPVRVTEFSVNEEAFDPDLNPLRAKVGIGLRVLSVDDLGFAHRGGSLFMNYLRTRERLAAMAAAGTLSALGIGGIG